MKFWKSLAMKQTYAKQPPRGVSSIERLSTEEMKLFLA
jgi:hypothetical protein